MESGAEQITEQSQWSMVGMPGMEEGQMTLREGLFKDGLPGPPGKPWGPSWCVVTSIMLLSMGRVVLTMWTLGVEVERCLWDRAPPVGG